MTSVTNTSNSQIPTLQMTRVNQNKRTLHPENSDINLLRLYHPSPHFTEEINYYLENNSQTGSAKEDDNNQSRSVKSIIPPIEYSP